MLAILPLKASAFNAFQMTRFKRRVLGRFFPFSLCNGGALLLDGFVGGFPCLPQATTGRTNLTQSAELLWFANIKLRSIELGRRDEELNG
jgi:hypothetical protein